MIDGASRRGLPHEGRYPLLRAFFECSWGLPCLLQLPVRPAMTPASSDRSSSSLEQPFIMLHSCVRVSICDETITSNGALGGHASEDPVVGLLHLS